jgi:SAM-dependent methyltransferase
VTRVRGKPPRGAEARARELQRLLDAGTRDHYEDAALYDFEYSDRVEDIRHYRGLARELGDTLDILELGAGTGRITVPLARDGHRIVALDLCRPMLDRLEAALERAPNTGHTSLREHVTSLQGDMREIPEGDARFDLVIAPFNALMHLYTWQDLLACFREAARVLRPGGTFAFDVQIPDLEWLRWDPEVRHAVTRFVHPVTREKLVYSTNHRYDAETQICHIRIYYDDAPPSGRKFVPPAVARRVVHLAHRQIFPEEVRHLVAHAGLELVALTGDFRGRPLGDAEDSQVAVCVKPVRPQ